MSIWLRISEALAAIGAGESLSAILEKLQTPPEKSVAFTIAVIGLGAKMAKADGQVTKDEVTAFRQIFHIPKRDEAQAAKVFNLARKDVAGFEVYAAKIAKMFRADSAVLEDLIEGLFYIAMADGHYHPNEDDYVQRVATIFGIDDATYRSFKTRFVPNTPPDAYDVLGVTPQTPLDEIRKIWRRKIRETHPDRMMARGLPEEAIIMATKRMVAINIAWEEINKTHKDA
ncbi:MAG: molecular chaperone DjiA [Proteobacteria bacterium]|nr:molecular chaperone DjiA [Pseudomonadota bacterium]